MVKLRYVALGGIYYAEFIQVGSSTRDLQRADFQRSTRIMKQQTFAKSLKVYELRLYNEQQYKQQRIPGRGTKVLTYHAHNLISTSTLCGSILAPHPYSGTMSSKSPLPIIYQFRTTFIQQSGTLFMFLCFLFPRIQSNGFRRLMSRIL